MSARIEKDYRFDAAMHVDDSFVINSYEMTLFISVETESTREQNIAIDRIDLLLYNYLDSCVLINKKDITAIEKYENAGIRVCELPDDPYDQILGSLIMLKLNAITEQKLVVTNLLFVSKVNSGIRFEIMLDQASRVFSGKHWWNENSLSLKDSGNNKKDKVVNLFDNVDDWEKFKLTWKENKT